MTDIPIKIAMLCWNPGGDAKVFIHPAEGRSRGYRMAGGACFFGWKDKTDQDRLLILMLEAWHGVVRDHVAPDAMHRALMVVPEFRASMADDVNVGRL